MKQTLSMKQIKKAITIGLFSCITLLLIFVSTLPGGVTSNYHVLLVGIIGIIAGLLPLILYNKLIVDFFNKIDEVINHMIDDNKNSDILGNLPSEDETIITRFWSKLHRLHKHQQLLQMKAQVGKETLQALVSDISHQVKTPLANIQIGLGILEQSDLPYAKRKEFLTSTQNSLNKLGFLLQALVTMSRLESGTIQLAPQKANIFDTLANSLGAILLYAEQKHLNIKVNCPDEAYTLHDPKWTGEAIFNILDNAVKYTPCGGCIEVTVEQWECYTKISVVDTGIGIPEELWASVFNRFYRAPNVHDEQGIGLGLTLAREIITKQRGYIKLETPKYCGTSISIFLPL